MKVLKLQRWVSDDPLSLSVDCNGCDEYCSPITMNSNGSDELHRHYPRFSLSFVIVPLDSHHWDTILRSFSVYSLFISFLLIWTPSQVLFKFLLFFLQFLVIGIPSQDLSQFIPYSFCFWLLKRYPRFSLSPSQVVSQFFLYAFGFLIIRTPSQVL